MTRGGYPEVISMPHVETPIRLGGRPLLFKGLGPEQFARYFRQGGIDPYYPERPWITNHMGTALDYAGLSAINNPNVRSGKSIDQVCMAIIDPRILERGHLRAIGAADAPILSVGLRDYKGDEHIGWDDVMKLVVTTKVWDTILAAYNIVKPKELSYQALADKSEIIESAPASGIKQGVVDLVHDKLLPRPTVPFRAW